MRLTTLPSNQHPEILITFVWPESCLCGSMGHTHPLRMATSAPAHETVPQAREKSHNANMSSVLDPEVFISVESSGHYSSGSRSLPVPFLARKDCRGRRRFSRSVAPHHRATPMAHTSCGNAPHTRLPHAGSLSIVGDALSCNAWLFRFLHLHHGSWHGSCPPGSGRIA